MKIILKISSDFAVISCQKLLIIFHIFVSHVHNNLILIQLYISELWKGDTRNNKKKEN